MKVQIGLAKMRLVECENCKQTAKLLTERIPDDHVIMLTPDINHLGIRIGWHLHCASVMSIKPQMLLDKVCTDIQWAKENDFEKTL